MLEVEIAQALAIARVPRMASESARLFDARGRVLAETITARADVPPQASSAMDGFAVVAADLAGANEEHPVALVVVGQSAAGHPFAGQVERGQTCAVMTGAVIPRGTDAIVLIEEVARAGDRVRIARAVKVQSHIRPAGDDLRAGEVAVARGAVLGAAELGALAAVGAAQVQVSRRPIVAVLSTGDELRDVEQAIGSDGIVDSNGHVLAAMIEDAGCIAKRFPIVRDEPHAIRAAIEDANACDFIVSTGGVSVGAHDHVKDVLAQMGATLDAWRVNMKPGKPVALAHLGDTPYFGLPGNPSSAMVAFWLFVRPALRAALGCREPFDLPRVSVKLCEEVRVKGERRTYLRARVDEKMRATPATKHGSHVMSAWVGTNALLALEPRKDAYEVGERVSALLIGPLAKETET